MTSPEQVDVCVRALEGVDHRGFDPADLDLGDRLLAQFARTFGRSDLRVLAQQVVDRIDPDGTVPQEKLNSDGATSRSASSPTACTPSKAA